MEKKKRVKLEEGKYYKCLMCQSLALPLGFPRKARSGSNPLYCLKCCGKPEAKTAIKQYRQLIGINGKKQQFAASMRVKQTTAEAAFQALLDQAGLAKKFKCQVVLYGFIGDFYAKSGRLCVEIDGPSHAKQVAYDTGRTMILNRHGIRVIRFKNGDVTDHPAEVVRKILEAMEMPKMETAFRPRSRRSRSRREQVTALGNLSKPSQTMRIVAVPARVQNLE